MFAAARLAPPADGERVTGLRLRLRRAGFIHREAATWFYGMRGVLTLLAPIAALGGIGMLYTGLSSIESMALAAAAAGAGFILPSFVLDMRVDALRTEYRAGFPDVLDLLVVCIEAGMTLNDIKPPPASTPLPDASDSLLLPPTPQGPEQPSSLLGPDPVKPPTP